MLVTIIVLSVIAYGVLAWLAGQYLGISGLRKYWGQDIDEVHRNVAQLRDELPKIREDWQSVKTELLEQTRDVMESSLKLFREEMQAKSNDETEKAAEIARKEQEDLHAILNDRLATFVSGQRLPTSSSDDVHSAEAKVEPIKSYPPTDLDAYYKKRGRATGTFRTESTVE